MARAAAAAQVDLFAWPHVHAAQQRADQAEADRLAAERRYRLAPHGEKNNRWAAFQQATVAAVAAEIALTKVVEEACQ